MSILRQKLKLVPNKDQNIQISIPANVGLNGLQEDIDDFVAEETGLSINDVQDAETFRYKPNNSFTMEVNFFSGGTYSPAYTQAGFTTGETSTRNEVILRSFFLLQVYDSVLIENQTLLHSGYYNGFNFIRVNDTEAVYTFNPANDTEFNNLYIPQSFINNISGDTVDLFGKISFYNAKTGELQLFSQKHGTLGSFEQPLIDEDLYFTITLTASTMQYNQPIIYAHELQNADYVEKVNETIESFENQRPTYPTGNTFVNTGQYIEN